MRFCRWWWLFAVTACLGCGSKSAAPKADGPKRTVAESRMAEPIRVTAIRVLPGGEVAATVSTDRDDWLSVSSDGGLTWQRRDVSRDAKERAVGVLAAAWHSGALWGLTRDGVLRSDDLGKSWKESIGGGPASRYGIFGSTSTLWSGDRTGDMIAVRGSGRLSQAGVVTQLLELPSKHLVVATFGKGVFRSVDDGATWAASVQGLDNLDVTALVSLGGAKVLAGLFGGGVVRSEDEGTTWKPSGEGLDDREIQALAYDGTSTVLAGAQRGLFRSTDEGRTWKRVDGDLARDNVQALAIDGKGIALAGTWGNGLLRSTDRGLTWQSVSLRGEEQDFTALTVARDGTVLTGTRAGAVYSLTEQGEGWAQQGDRVGNLEIVAVARSPRGALFAGTSAGLYRLDSGGSHWARVDLASANEPLGGVVVAQDGTLFVSVRSLKRELDGLHTSTDDGKTWTRRTEGCLEYNPGAMLRTNASGTVILASCRCMSKDGGRTWSSQDVASGYMCSADVGSMHAVAVGSNNFSSFGVYVAKSGADFASQADLEGAPSCVAVAPSGEIFVVQRKGVVSFPAGDKVAYERAAGDFSCNRMLAGAQGSMLIAGQGGLRRSSDGGKTWVRIDGLRPPEPPAPGKTPPVGGKTR